MASTLYRATDWQTWQKGVRVTVADNGEGMSAATRARIFEPFFKPKHRYTNIAEQR